MTTPLVIPDAGLSLRPEGSHVRVRTFAEGMLARLAHDLELEWPIAALEVDAKGERPTAKVRLDPEAVRVVGTRKGDVLDEGALSSSDRADIVKKLLASIGADRRGAEIRAEISMASTSATRAKIDVELPCGRATTDATVTLSPADGGARATGTMRLSLRGLGVAEVKGPLGAFRLKDAIELSFTAELR